MQSDITIFPVNFLFFLHQIKDVSMMKPGLYGMDPGIVFTNAVWAHNQNLVDSFCLNDPVRA